MVTHGKKKLFNMLNRFNTLKSTLLFFSFQHTIGVITLLNKLLNTSIARVSKRWYIFHSYLFPKKIEESTMINLSLCQTNSLSNTIIWMLFVIPSCVLSIDEHHKHCSPSFRCGNQRELYYPFWISEKKEWGHPDFEVNCSGDFADLTPNPWDELWVSYHKTSQNGLSQQSLSSASCECIDQPWCPSISSRHRARNLLSRLPINGRYTSQRLH